MGRRILTTAAFMTAGLAMIAWAALADASWAQRHALPLYCPTEPHPPSWLLSLRACAGLLGLVLAAWLGPRAGRWAAHRSTAQLLASMLTIGVPLVLAMGATELILRRAPIAKPLMDPFLPPMRLDAHGWFANTPSASKQVRIHDQPVWYFIDANGNRVLDASAQPSRSAPTILVAGESIGLGYDLPYEQTCAGVLADALGVQVVNLSVTGYAADQAYLRLKDALAWFEHPIATVTFVVPAALARTARHTSPRLARTESGQLELIPADWRSRSLLWTLLDRVTPFHSDEAIELTRAILTETVRASEARGARAVFVMTNYGASCLPDGEGTPVLARELFDGVHAPHAIVDIGEGERTGGYDLHPNLAGERRLTAAILSMLPGRP